MIFVFGMRINIKVFYKLILSFWICIPRHAENIQNNKCVISFQYLEEKVKEEVDVLPADN